MSTHANAPIPAASRRLRWGVAAAIVTNVVVNELLATTVVIGDGTVAELSARYDSLFTPAPYAFAIWGVIFATLLSYAVVQLLPSERRAPIYDRLAPPLIGVNLLSAAWPLVFQHCYFAASVVVIAVMLTLSAVAFTRAQAAVATGLYSRWLAVPMALLLAWLSVATIANIATALVAMGFTGGPVSPIAWTVILLVAATLIAGELAERYHDYLVPAVVAWSTIAIWVDRRGDEPVVAGAALAVTGILVLHVLRQASWQLRHRRAARPSSHPRPWPAR
ncbi:MAG: hypothetical protein R2939_02860 [Kofleriaceae bacterium]